ncbi:reverse transcriptase, partial [Globisporangium splendens]
MFFATNLPSQFRYYWYLLHTAAAAFTEDPDDNDNDNDNTSANESEESKKKSDDRKEKKTRQGGPPTWSPASCRMRRRGTPRNVEHVVAFVWLIYGSGASLVGFCGTHERTRAADSLSSSSSSSLAAHSSSSLLAASLSLLSSLLINKLNPEDATRPTASEASWLRYCLAPLSFLQSVRERECTTESRCACLSMHATARTYVPRDWRGLMQSVRYAREHNCEPLHVAGDSSMIIRQQWNHKAPRNARLKRLFQKTQQLANSMCIRTWTHHLRAYNKMADLAANHAMDNAASRQYTFPTTCADGHAIQQHVENDVSHWFIQHQRNSNNDWLSTSVVSRNVRFFLHHTSG